MSKRVVKLNKKQFDEMVQTIYEQTISSMEIKKEGLFDDEDENPRYDPTKNARKKLSDIMPHGDLDNVKTDKPAIKGPEVIDDLFDKTKETKQAYRIIGTIYDTIFSVKDSEKFKEYLRNYKH